MRLNCVSCYKLLSTTQRYRIFEYLRQGKKKMTVSALVKMTALKQPTVTFHIDELAKRGLLKKVKVGRNVYCRATRRCARCPLFAV